jgi:hypothetical protein
MAYGTVRVDLILVCRHRQTLSSPQMGEASGATATAMLVRGLVDGDVSGRMSLLSLDGVARARNEKRGQKIYWVKAEDLTDD